MKNITIKNAPKMIPLLESANHKEENIIKREKRYKNSKPRFPHLKLASFKFKK